MLWRKSWVDFPMTSRPQSATSGSKTQKISHQETAIGSAFQCNHIKPVGLAIHNNRESPDFHNLPNREVANSIPLSENHDRSQDRPLEYGITSAWRAIDLNIDHELGNTQDDRKPSAHPKLWGAGSKATRPRIHALTPPKMTHTPILARRPRRKPTTVIQREGNRVKRSTKDKVTSSLSVSS